MEITFAVLHLVSTKITNPIWSEYTAALIKWEKSNSIYSHLKKLKRKRKPRYIKSPNNKSNLTTPNSSQPISCSPRSTNPDPVSNTDRVSDPTPPNERNDTTLHIEHSRLPPNFWVYFTSSYFRHGGNIYTHFTQDAASQIMTQ